MFLSICCRDRAHFAPRSKNEILFVSWVRKLGHHFVAIVPILLTSKCILRYSSYRKEEKREKTHTHTHTYTNIGKNTHTHTQTHTHTHKHTHTHTLEFNGRDTSDLAKLCSLSCYELKNRFDRSMDISVLILFRRSHYRPIA